MSIPENIIEISNITKKYKLGVFDQKSFIEDLQKFFKKTRFIEDKSKFHLALDDITFDVQRGDSLAIIGKNGSGKSTLLKVLSKITSPTKGSIRYKGKIVSVLEQGIGFHPELTAKDNIFLNGAILGCSKDFLASNIDSIISFAGISKYLNTPLKRYSSGMITRLGFAICAHIPSDILIVDEVLAVGDQNFRNKAINLMKEYIENQNKTLIFVSHEEDLLKKLCSKAILLDEGKKIFGGSLNDALNLYNKINIEK